MKEKHENQFFNAKWNTEAGTLESVETVKRIAESCLDDPQKFWQLAKFYGSPDDKFGEVTRFELWESPFGWAFLYGIKSLSFEDKDQTEEVRKLLVGYPIEIIISSAVFNFESVGVDELVDPAGTALKMTGIDLMIQRARESKTQAASLETIERIVEGSQSFQEFMTPQGRVRQLVEPYVALVSNPLLLKTAVERVEDKHGAKAVGLALRKLLNV